ncbi:MAG: 4a-hydroxytetrahydrobiopterin dehydratase [Acidobacteriota bacterium]|nr:MAG: 4a-hydroxytetrahydrobiopterin dehydratase [Acidobacteriota bacterium]
MSDLAKKRCTPSRSGDVPISAADARQLLGQLDSGWCVVDEGAALRREIRFSDYLRTMAFVNAVAWIAHSEDHHPDLEVGYNRCLIRYATHSIGGLSENDFICAAKIDALLAAEKGSPVAAE